MTQSELHTLAQQKLENARIQLDLDEFDQKRLAKSGPAIFVCNQLFNGLDEWILVYLLTKYFENIRLLHPYPAPAPKELQPFLVKSQQTSLDSGLFGMNVAKRLIRQVGKGTAVALVVDFSDNPFNHRGKNLLRPQILNRIRQARQPVVPIHLITEKRSGGLLRRVLSSLAFGKAPAPVQVSVRVGLPIQPETISLFEKNSQWHKFIQAKIFALGSRFDLHPEHFTHAGTSGEVPLADPVDPALIRAEFDTLKKEYKVTSRGQFDVFIAPFLALPNIILEIGRLRELSFRAVGEGTGKPRDIDEYDIYYLQLIIWDREAGKIVGGYRLGQGDEIIAHFGINGLYVSSLFKIKPGFFPVMQQAIELGRSYVVPEYQKHRLPLFLLWKGILHFLLEHRHYRYLYGPVSISKYYSNISKSLIVEFVTRYYMDQEMARHVRPRKPFRFKSRGIDTQLMAEGLRGEFEALESLIEDIEPQHFSVPVLFRQYLRQSAKFIAFNVDPAFSDCLDGLMILDISKLPASTIEALQQER